MKPLSIRKLRTIEDEGLQEGIARVNAADQFARDIVIAGAIPEAEGWARISQAIDDLSGSERDDDFDEDREEWGYLLGVAVGLRLAALQAGGAQ
jgi:hypothetical protein